MTQYRRFYLDEWSGLYADGKLLCYGDHYVVDEKLAEILGVENYSWEDGNDFTLGTGRSPAEDEAEIFAYADDLSRKEEQAQDFEDQAKDLLRRAAELRKWKS